VSSQASDRIRWYPRVVVAKYSPDQTGWALGRLPAGGMPPRLDGSVLRRLFPEPEDGYAYDAGNALVTSGLANLVNVVTGGGFPLAPGRACFGVGADATAFTPDQQHLARSGEHAGTSFYQPMDAGYPVVRDGGIVAGQATFAAEDANFSWLEWCWVSGPGLATAGPVLAEVYAAHGSGIMMNRKVPASPGLGKKEFGASWVFSSEVGFS
jgi:hypothetical protein